MTKKQTFYLLGLIVAIAGYWYLIAEATPAYVVSLYRNLLRRENNPTSDEVNGWVRRGLSRLELRKRFKTTSEYLALRG